MYHFGCPNAKGRKTKLVGVTNAAIEPTMIEQCKKGHAMELERIEERQARGGPSRYRTLE